MTDFEIQNLLIRDGEQTETFLRSLFANRAAEPLLLEAEQYSLFAGGKRIRPALVLEFCRLFCGENRAALPFAAAVEMIHTYSLIHDDLPCMDDDALRRGKPTNHKVFGEAAAVLAGDALLTDAFGVVAANDAVSPELRMEAVRLLSLAAGSDGMVSGQVLDMMGETRRLKREELLRLHRRKTGALIRASAQLGSLAAGVSPDSSEMRVAERYADCIGLAFQIVDDILDATAGEEVLGKSVGGDAVRGKTTFLTYDSVQEAAAYAGQLTAEAAEAVKPYRGSDFLVALAEYLLKRKN